MSESQWGQPQEIDDVRLAFPASISDLMPSREEAEAGLDKLKNGGRDWIRFQRDWFFSGLTQPIEKSKPKKGIDANLAFRHLAAIQGSFEPKHEHKEAAVAFLASQWFKEPPK